jgi:phage shock protein E
MHAKSTLLLSFLFVASFLSCKSDASAQGPIKDVQAQLIKEPGQVVDVRTLEEWNSGHYHKAIHADWLNGDFQKQAAKWDKSKTYYLHCAAGGRSGNAAEYLKSQGFKHVYNLGGYDRVKNLK